MADARTTGKLIRPALRVRQAAACDQNGSYRDGGRHILRHIDDRNPVRCVGQSSGRPMPHRTTAASQVVLFVLLTAAATSAGAQAPAAPPIPDAGPELPARVERFVVRDVVEADGRASRVTEARVSLRNNA